MAQTDAESRTMKTVAASAAILVALVLSAGALIVAAGGSSSGAPTVAAGASADASDAPAEASVTLDEMSITPGDIEVGAGGTLVVTNAGAAAHDLVVEDADLATPMIEAGGEATLDLADLEAGTYTVFCSVPGHRAGGMEATLVVGGGGDAGGDDAGDDAAASSDGAASSDAVTFDPDVAAPDGFEARDPRLAPAEDVDVHEITLRATEIEGTVGPEVTQQLWTFNDVVPGPVLRGEVGDVFRITLVNDGDMPHSIDFHSSKVAPNEEMRTIQPGEELVYEFEAKHAGVWMYHCATAPALHHIGAGMYGAMIIDPPDLPEVDHEYLFVQSEFSLGAEDEPGDLSKMMEEDSDIVAFNGYANQYVHDPIDEVEVGERVRAWVLDAGPSENSSFHVIGTIFDTVYKEGAYRLTPDDPGGAQALDLQPAQGGFVEFTFDTDGVYTFVTHKFSNIPKGAAGLFQVGDVDADAGH